jgi:hypothetical protein
MNIPAWFEQAARGYEVLGKSACADLIRKAAATIDRERTKLEAANTTIATAFAYCDDSPFDEFDEQLEQVGWWSDNDRIAYVRAHRGAFKNDDA